MRNPGKAIGWWGLTAAIGTGCVVAPFLLFDYKTESAVPVILTVIGVTLAPISAGVTIAKLVAMRQLARLRGGRGELARWRLGPEEWRAFVSANGRRNTELLNALPIHKHVPEGGVEVIVGEKDVAVHDYVQSMRVGGMASSFVWIEWLAGAPPMLECTFRVQSGRYSTRLETLRFPVAAEARADGMRVYQHFRAIAEKAASRTSIAMRNPRRTIQVCAAILAVCLVAVLWGFANRDGGSEAPVVPLIAAVTGTVTGLACLLMIVIVAVASRGRRG